MQMCRNVSLQLRAYELRLRRVKPSTHQIAPARFQSDGVASYASKPLGADDKGRNAALDVCWTSAPHPHDCDISWLAALLKRKRTINRALLSSVAALCHCCAFKQRALF